MDAQLKKGVLEMCILHYISQETRYGYDIMKYMHKFFPDVSESTIYAILRRLNKSHVTDVIYGEESNGPRRKYFNITELGREMLSKEINEWNNLTEIIKQLGI